MRWMVLVVLLTASSLVAIGNSDDAPNKGLVPQAQPVFTWLKVVKDGDQEKLKAVFSESIREQFDKEGWDKVLKAYQEVFKNEFGDYKLEDFAFEFAGEEEKGTVSIVHKTKKLPGLRVIKEKGDWKVNERKHTCPRPNESLDRTADNIVCKGDG